jgi:hypothetical protein
VAQYINTLMNKAFLARLPGYEPGDRGFKSCRARQINKGLRQPQPFLFLWAGAGLAARTGEERRPGDGAKTI